MNNTNYLAAMAHIGWAAFLTALVNGHANPALYPFLTTAVVLAGLKEFWFDARYELPKQTAWDNWSDFLEYLVGLGLGFGLTFLPVWS